MRRHSFVSFICATLVLGWLLPASLPTRAQAPGESGAMAMTLSEARGVIDSRDLRRAFAIVSAIDGGRLEATAAEKVDLLTRIYSMARASGGDETEFVGGQPLEHSSLQIASIRELQNLPPAEAAPAISALAGRFLDDLEALSPERRRLSPLQALEAPFGALLLSRAGDPAVAGAVRRFIATPAVSEYAKWELAVAEARRHVAPFPAAQMGSRARPVASPSKSAETIVESFTSAALPEIRQHGKRVEACCALLSDVIGDDVSPLDGFLRAGATTPAGRYFVATYVARYLRGRAASGLPLDSKDAERLRGVIATCREARVKLGEGRYGEKPLERALTALAEVLPDARDRARVSAALAGEAPPAAPRGK